MKIKIGDFEVDVKAKTEFSDKMNAEDTKHFLCCLGNAFASASNWQNMQGFQYTAKRLQEMSSDIYNAVL